MASAKYLIVGGGLAAASAVKQLVQVDPSAKGSTLIVTAENEPPYHRPPLSKGYLKGDEGYDDILVEPKAFYEENGIDIWYRCNGRLIDPASRTMELELNKSVKFQKALIATGSSPVRYIGQGRGLEGIHYLRNVADSDRIKKASEGWNEVVIVGSSFIGMELASAFAQNNIRTTVISKSLLPWSRLYNTEASTFFLDYFQKRGVKFVLGDEPAGFIGTGAVHTVHTQKGVKLSCDAVVVGIGVKPNTQIAEASRMEVNDGIVVNDQLQTSQPNVWAAGDVARYADPLSGESIRVEHWDNALKQGEVAGRNLAGAGESYSEVPMFFSDIFDLSFELWGVPVRPDVVIQRMTPSAKGLFSLYVRDDVIQAALLMGQTEEDSEMVQKLIRNRTNIHNRYDILRDNNRSLGDLL